MAGGTVRISEVYGRRQAGSNPRPPAVNEASGPIEKDNRPALFWFGMVAMLVLLRVVWDRAE